MKFTLSASFVLAVPLWVFSTTTARRPAAIEVCGRLVGADGRPMMHATVVVSRPVLPGSGLINEDERVLGTQELAATAAFCVKVSGASLLQVQAFGVNHEAADALLWAEPGSRHEVSIKLATPALATDLSAARVTCYQSLPSFRTLGDAPLVRQADGRYLAVIKGPDVPTSCGLYGVTRGTCVGVEPRGPDCLQGTQADRYELRRAFGIGRYAAIVTPMHGEGHLVLDRSALPRPDGPPAVTFPPADPTATRLTAMWQTMLARDLRDRSGAPPSRSRTEIANALGAARAEPELVVRQMLWANYVSLATAHMRAPAPAHAADRAGAAAALRALTPSSAFWPLVLTHLFDAVRTAGLSSTPDGYAGEVVRNLRIPSERPVTMNAFADAARREHDIAAQNGWLGWLLHDYAGHPVARSARERYGLNDKVQVGRPFPEFAVRSLDDPAVTLTAKSIGGRFLLVDFWATWCAPCIEEIPGLQKAYARFSDQGLRILSYSLDTDADLVRQFRRDRLSMPWLHGMFPQGPDGLNTEFGLVGIPAPVLLDAEGRVVAMRDDLLGGKLEALLATLIR